MKLLYYTYKSLLAKVLLVALTIGILQIRLVAQTCSPAVSAPTLSATTQPLLCPAISADLSGLVTSTTPIDITRHQLLKSRFYQPFGLSPIVAPIARI